MEKINKLYLILTTGIALLMLQSCSYHTSRGIARASQGDAEDIKARAIHELQMLADPATGQIPYHIREKELAFAATLPVNRSAADALSKTGGSLWQSRGPWNVGGRTRAIAIDKTNERVIIAGGVSGGIWRSTDSGMNWIRVTDSTSQINISCILQNTKKRQNQYLVCRDWRKFWKCGFRRKKCKVPR